MRIQGIMSMSAFAKALGVSRATAKKLADENPEYYVDIAGSRWVGAGLYYKVSGMPKPNIALEEVG